MYHELIHEGRNPLLVFASSDADSDSEIGSLNYSRETIRFTSIFKNIFSITIPVTLYNITSTITYALRILMVTSMSEDQNAFATYYLVNIASVFLLSGRSIFNVMEGIISKECSDEAKFERGKNVGSILQSAWIIAAIFSVLSGLITFNLSPILRLMGIDKDICDGISNIATLYSIVIPIRIILSANISFLTCTNSKRNVLLFSINAAGVGLMINFILAKFFLKKSILKATIVGLMIESLIALITSTGYILFCNKYKLFMIKKVSFKRVIKQFKTLFLSGIPVVLYNILLATIDIVIVLMFGWCGSDRILLDSAAQQIIYFSSPFFTGINRAACILVGRSFGAKNFSNVRRYGYTVLGLNMLLTVTLLVIYLLIPKKIASSIINPDLFDDSTIQWVFFLTALTNIAKTISRSSVANLEGLMTVSMPSLMNFLISLCTTIPLAGLLAFTLKLDMVGINLGCAIGASATALNTFIWWLMSSRDVSLAKNYSNSSAETSTRNHNLSIFSNLEEIELVEHSSSDNQIHDSVDDQVQTFQ